MHKEYININNCSYRRKMKSTLLFIYLFYQFMNAFGTLLSLRHSKKLLKNISRMYK